MKLPKGEIIPLKTDFMFCHIFNDPENKGFIACCLDLTLNIKYGEENAYNNIHK